MALFLDIYPLSAQASNDALEYIFKAQQDGGSGNDGIWSLHESILIRNLIELFTQRGLDRLSAVQEHILAWESGAKHKPSPAPATPPGMMHRWTEAERKMAELYLESLPPATWSFDDHMMAVELVFQTYLPDDQLATEAEWLAVKSSLMGKVQANLDKEASPSAKQVDAVLAAVPSSVDAARRMSTLSPVQQAAMEYGALRCAENVRALTDRARHRMRSTILEHVHGEMTGTTTTALETRLVDEFAVMNRDWRRIAVTEAGECQTQGFVASQPPGTRLERVEQYADACSWCRKIHGRVLEVVEPDAPNKDGDTQIWAGKTNVGRYASPMKRQGGVLVPRDPDEMYWIAAGVQHPHCRGRWVPTIQAEQGDDPEFAAMLADILS